MLTTTTPTPLVYDPLEWADVSLRWGRKKSFHGVMRSFVAPVTFCKDGAAILQKIYYTQGMEGRCVFVVEKMKEKITTSAGDETYEPYYEGEIDFSQVSDGGLTFKVAVLDAGLEAVVTAKDDTPYEIPVLDIDSQKVYMDGTMLQSRQPYTIIGGPSLVGGVISQFQISNVLPVAAGEIEGFSAGLTQDQLLAPITGTTPDIDVDYIYEAKRTQSITINIIDLEINYAVLFAGGSLQQKVQIYARYGQTGAFVDQLIWSSSFVARSTSQTFLVNAAVTIPLVGPSIPSDTGDRVALYFFFTDATGTFINTTPNSSHLVKILTSTGKVEIVTQFQPDPIVYRGYRYWTFVQKHFAALADGQYSIASDYLSNSKLADVDSYAFNVIVSSGDAMRRLGDGANVGTAPKIVTALKDIRNDLFARNLCGVGVEGNTLRIEKLGHFYDNSTVTLTLPGEVDRNKLQLIAAPEYLYNLFKIGYQPQTKDDIGGSLNGRYDFHNTLTFSGSGLREPKEFAAVTDYITSMYAVNFICFNLANKKTTDTRNDNSIYLVEVNGTTAAGEYMLARPQTYVGNSMSGVLDSATAFNVPLSPKRNMLRLAPWLAIGYHLRNSEVLKYQTTDKNSSVISNLGAVVNETDDVAAASLTDPLFLPIVFQFETQVPVNIVDTVDASPYGRINFQVRDKYNILHTVGGFIQEISANPSTHESQTWQLLCAPDVDLSIFH